MFGGSGFLLAYASTDVETAFLFLHGGIAILVYLVFYLVIFGWDEVRWMFINAAIGSHASTPGGRLTLIVCPRLS